MRGEVGGEFGPEAGVCADERDAPPGQRGVRRGRRLRDGYGDSEAEGRAGAVCAFNGEVAAEEAGKVAADGETEAGTAMAAPEAVVELAEREEEPGLFRRRDARAGITDGKFEETGA